MSEATSNPRPPRQPRRGNRRVTGILLAITGLGLLVFLGSIGLAAWLLTRADRGDVSDGSWLFVELSGGLPEAPPPPSLFEDPNQSPPLASEVPAAIRKAAADDRITGIYLQLDGPTLGWATTQELRRALIGFREAGKRCVAYADIYDTKSYYLASACDRVLIAPSGMSAISGLAVSVTYYKGTFDKLGIEAEFEHVGDYKTFIEPYERTGPSEGAVIAYEHLVDSLYGQLVTDIAASRGLDEAAVRAAIDEMHFSGAVNVERGLYDGVAFPDAIRATIDRSGEDGWIGTLLDTYDEPEDDKYKKLYTSLSEYLKEQRADEKSGKAKIAVIHAEGPIVSGDGDQGLFGGSGTLADGPFRKWMRDARQDDDVKAVVLRVNSPGGSALASDMMWHEVEMTRAAGKPVVVSMTNYAASGGYFIACNADWIVAERGTLTGSIGVGGGKFNLAGTYEKLGLTEHHFKRGERADLLTVTTPFTEGGRQMFRESMDEAYRGFVGKVAAGRKKTFDEAHAVAQGRVWTGEQALEHGLVDELGGLDTALTKAASLAGLEEYGLRRLPKRLTFWETVMEEMGSTAVFTPRVEIAVPGARLLDDAVRDVLILEHIFRDGPVVMLPGNLHID